MRGSMTTFGSGASWGWFSKVSQGGADALENARDLPPLGAALAGRHRVARIGGADALSPARVKGAAEATKLSRLLSAKAPEHGADPASGTSSYAYYWPAVTR